MAKDRVARLFIVCYELQRQQAAYPMKDKGKEVGEELRRSAVREQEVLTIFQQDYKI